MLIASKNVKEAERSVKKKQKQMISNIYALCNINNQVTWGEKFYGDTGEDNFC